MESQEEVNQAEPVKEQEANSGAQESTDQLWNSLVGGDNPFIVPEDTSQKPQQQKENPVNETEEQRKQRELDERSYRYWQSQADKRQAELERTRQELEALKSGATRNLPPRDPNTGQFVHEQQSIQAQQQPVQQQETFPAPPPRPQQPRGFSRAEAYADDRSESARYLDELDRWNADMQEYNAVKVEYSQIMQQQALDKQRMEFEQRERARQAQIAQQRQISSIAAKLRDGYRMSDQQVSEFFQEMSNPRSLSIENLYKLYALNHGIPIENSNQQQQQQVAQPSADFQQQQKAQQAPNPMGVMPAFGTTAQNRDPVDILMDDMVNMSKRDNPFG